MFCIGGNSYMNIIAICLYLVRIALIGVAIGILYIRCGLFNKLGKTFIMMIGIASSPMFLSFVLYIMGFFIGGGQDWIYYAIPLIISIIWIIYPKNRMLMIAVIRESHSGLKDQIKRLGSWFFLDVIIATSVILYNAFCFSTNNNFNESILKIFSSLNLAGYGIASIMTISVLGTILYSIRQMIKNKVFLRNLFAMILFIVAGCGLYLGVSLNGRPMCDSDRAHYELEARYFAEDKNSWQIDNYKDEKYGSTLRDDHGPLWVLNLSDTYMTANMLKIEEPIRVTNAGVLWDYICFQMLLFIMAMFLAKTKKAGVLALCLFNFYEHEATFMLWGSRDAFRFVGLLLLLLYVCNLFSEMVQSKEVPKHHFFFMALFCYFSIQGHTGNTCIMFGMFILMGAVMICCCVEKKRIIYCIISVLIGSLFGSAKTISMYFSTGRIDSSSLTAFHGTPVVRQILESEAESIAWDTIWNSYSIPVLFVIALGTIGLVILLVISWKQEEREMFVYGIMIMGMLLPLLGIFDWIGYEFAIWFIEQLRYRMYFLMLFSITGAWFLVQPWKNKRLRYVMLILVICCLCIYQRQEYYKYITYPKMSIGAWKAKVEEWKEIGVIVEKISDRDTFVYNEALLYYLKGTPKLLFHSYSEELLQAKTDEEIRRAVERLNIGAIILPSSGMEYHDYSLLPFWRYINDSNEFGMITQEERAGSLDYVIYYYKNERD
jgi:hypothetical protein